MSAKNEFLRSGPAELYTLTYSRKMDYRRFETAEKAVRFTIERLPKSNLTATVLEVNEVRFDHIGIRKLYEDLCEYAPSSNGEPENTVSDVDRRQSAQRKPWRMIAIRQD